MDWGQTTPYTLSGSRCCPVPQIIAAYLPRRGCEIRHLAMRKTALPTCCICTFCPQHCRTKKQKQPWILDMVFSSRQFVRFRSRCFLYPFINMQERRASFTSYVFMWDGDRRLVDFKRVGEGWFVLRRSYQWVNVSRTPTYLTPHQGCASLWTRLRGCEPWRFIWGTALLISSTPHVQLQLPSPVTADLSADWDSSMSDQSYLILILNEPFNIKCG